VGGKGTIMETLQLAISQSVTTFDPLDNVGLPKVITFPARGYVERRDKEAGDGLWYRSAMSQGSHLQL